MLFRLDTHAAPNGLIAAGLPPEQAEAVVQTILQSVSATASKADLDAIVARLDASDAAIRGLDHRLDLAASQEDVFKESTRIVKWVGVLLGIIMILLFMTAFPDL